MKTNQRAIITVGASGSGKSTWAREYAQTRNREYGESWVIVERDQARKNMKPKSSHDVNFWSEWNWKLEESITDVCNEKIVAAVMNGDNIIISDTNLNKKFRDSLIKDLKSAGYTCELKHFNVQYKQLLERDNKRADSVGQQIVAKQYFQYMNEFGHMYGYNKLDTTPEKSCVLFDIDGTLAHMNGRRGPFEWEKVGLDTVDETVKNILISYWNRGLLVYIMSGRDAVCGKQTVEWLNTNQIPFHSIFMRPEGDTRSDFEVKNEIIQTYINGNYRVEAWFDDRPTVVRLGHILGAKMFAVGNQHLEF